MAHTTVLVEFIALFALGILYIVYAALNKGAGIVLADTEKQKKKKHRLTRLSSAIRVAGLGMIVTAFFLVIVYENQLNSTKDKQGGGTVNTEYWRWLGYIVFNTAMAYMYLEYACTYTEDRWFTILLVFFGGLGGAFISAFPEANSDSMVVGVVFMFVAMLAAAVSSMFVTNIRINGIPWQYAVWAMVFLFSPVIQGILLVVGPEGYREETRSMVSIGYVVVTIFTAFVAPIVVIITFMATKRLSVSATEHQLMTMRSGRKMSDADMTSADNSMLNGLNAFSKR